MKKVKTRQTWQDFTKTEKKQLTKQGQFAIINRFLSESGKTLFHLLHFQFIHLNPESQVETVNRKQPNRAFNAAHPFPVRPDTILCTGV